MLGLMLKQSLFNRVSKLLSFVNHRNQELRNLATKKLSNLNKKMAHKKVNLPEKICVTCGLKFAWRKKWEKNWEEVKYCSEKCRRNKIV